MNSLTTTDDQKSMVYPGFFLRQLPESIRVVLARDPPTSITDRSKAADDILAVQSLASGIAAVSAGKMGRRSHPSSGKTGTCFFYHAKLGEKAHKCGDTSSAATCDMAHLTELGKCLRRPLAFKEVCNHHQDGRNTMSVWIVKQADITSLILAQTSQSFLPPPLTDNIVQQLNPLLQQMTPESQPGARGTLLSILAPAPSLNPFTLQIYANLFWVQTFSFPITSWSISSDVASFIFSLKLSFR